MQQEHIYQSPLLADMEPEEYVVSPASKTMLVPVFREPDEAAPLLKRLPADTIVTTIARVDSWLFVRIAAGEHGYIRANDARSLNAPETDADAESSSTEEPPQTALLPYIVDPSAASQSVPVFCEPSMNVPVIGNLDAGARISVISQDASWLYIQISPEQRGYIVAGNARPATDEELNSSEAAPVPDAVRSTSNPPYPRIVPRRYIIKPTVGLRAAIFREADQNSEMLGTLEPDTIVEVIWVSERWLGIQRSPGEYAYIRKVNARPARTGELDKIEGTSIPEISAADAPWPVVKPPYPLIVPPLRYVTKLSVGLSVPVFREPDSSTKAFAHLSADVEVKVVWKSLLWLCIRRGPGEYGYIRQADVRPWGTSPRAGSTTNKAGSNDSKAKARPWFGATWASVIFGIACLILGAILASGKKRLASSFFARQLILLPSRRRHAMCWATFYWDSAQLH
jgi:hypothetical protein